MKDRPKILILGGSLREKSYNQQLAAVAAQAADSAGAEVTLVSLRDFAIPLYDADFEAQNGMPPGARDLKALFSESDGWVIASPEYNGGVTGALKNALDWVSRVTSPEEPMYSAFRGKVAAIVSASPGGLGGARGLAQLRVLLENLQATVISEQVTVARVHEVFDADGNAASAPVLAEVEDLMGRLVQKLSAEAP